jgi:hypothetical protein
MESSPSINVSYVASKNSSQATNVLPDALLIKLGVELLASAEPVTQESMESAESSTVDLMSPLMASNVSVSQDSKESTQSAGTSLAPQMKFSTALNVSVSKATKELTPSAKSPNVLQTHSGTANNALAIKALSESESVASSNAAKMHILTKLAHAFA